MIFEIGKCYKHNTGQMISVIADAETTMYGKTLIAEQSGCADFMACGADADCYAENWHEISNDEWMTGFSES